MMQRRFPPPWSVEELDACFVVRDHNGQKLALVYLKNELKDALTFLGEARATRENHGDLTTYQIGR
jgi:hypothetical protein